MKKGNLSGIVIECLPNLEYRVELTDGRVIRCYMAGKMRLKKVKVLLGDRVELQHDATMGEIGRITWRYA